MEPADAPSEFRNNDADSAKNRRTYEAMVRAIEQRLDPDSNTVLIVDDEEGIRRFVARKIRRQDRRVVIYEAENGREALDKLAEMRRKYHRGPLFIVTDLNMPVMDGWEFIEHLRKEYTEKGLAQGIPIIVLSSTSGEKGIAFFKKSVHAGKARYKPLASVAKEVCMDPAKYDASGEKGLANWMKHFMRG